MRINFFGGPGSGKSTTAARVFSQLKERMVSVELVTEYVKSWAHMGRHVKRFDQLYLFGKQHQYEYRLLENVKNIVTDSPVWLSAFYATHYGQPQIAGPIQDLCRIYDAEHPCLNIFLRRGDKPYVQEGRYQTAEEAAALDGSMLTMLRAFYGEQVVELEWNDRDAILTAALNMATE